MRKLSLLFILMLMPLMASAQWEFDSYFPPDTSLWDTEITDVHGIVVDKAGKIWVQPFFASEEVEFQGDTLSTRAIYVFNPDGSQTDFSPIIFLKDAEGNNLDTLGREKGGAMSGRGMRIDDDGNILVMQFNMLYRLDSDDAVLLNWTLTGDGSKAAPAADLSGRVYIANVVPGNPIQRFEKDFTMESTSEVLVSESVGFSRSFEVSGDGANIYCAGYTNGYVLVYNQPDEFSPFGTPDTVARGFRPESFTFNPATQQLWMSAGSFNDVPAAPWNPNTWYAFNADDLNNPVDSLKWFSAFTAPDDDRALAYDDSRPRALGFTSDGTTAFIGAFSHSSFNTDAAGNPVSTPALQKIVDNTDRTKQVDFTWDYSGLFPSDTLFQFSSTHGLAVDGDGKLWVQPFGSTETITRADGEEVSTRALYIFNPDGTPADFSPLIYINYADGGVDTVGWAVNNGAWESFSGRGLKTDHEGNIIVSTGGIIHKVGKNGEGLGKFFYRGADGNLDSPTAAGIDEQGNVYIGPVVPGANQLIKLPSDFTPETTPEVILSATEGFARSMEVSADGNRIYWGGFTNIGVYVYERPDEFTPFNPASFTIMNGLKAESFVFHPNGQIWMSAGSPNDAPSNGYESQTWYGFDESNLNDPVESLTWNAEAKGEFGGRPRAIAFSPEGDVAYVGQFSETAPSVQKFEGKTATSVDEPTAQLPETFKLEQNYPNPFNPTTTINFRLPAAGQATLQVFDINGRLVSTLVNREMLAGQHTVNFDASNLSSGVYIYRLSAGDFNLTRKMTLIK